GKDGKPGVQNQSHDKPANPEENSAPEFCMAIQRQLAAHALGATVAQHGRIGAIVLAGDGLLAQLADVACRLAVILRGSKLRSVLRNFVLWHRALKITRICSRVAPPFGDGS